MYNFIYNKYSILSFIVLKNFKPYFYIKTLFIKIKFFVNKIYNSTGWYKFLPPPKEKYSSNPFIRRSCELTQGTFTYNGVVWLVAAGANRILEAPHLVFFAAKIQLIQWSEAARFLNSTVLISLLWLWWGNKTSFLTPSVIHLICFFIFHADPIEVPIQLFN